MNQVNSNYSKLHNLQGTLRVKILELHKKANAGHIGCSLSCIDLLIASLIHHKTDKDKFILSKGHAAVALYICLNHLGEISEKELKTFYKNGTKLAAHPIPNSFKAIPFATGSLGHGFPIGAGIAKAKKLSNKHSLVYVLMSDGETNEGTTWEAAHFAVQHKLDNLIIIIDRNGLQAFGETNNILGDGSMPEKWRVLGFDTIEIDGHDIKQIIETIEKLKQDRNLCPKVIIANTIKGKGVSFMESQLKWHYLTMTEEQYNLAINEITIKYLQ